ncbi:MAG: saccharopine dehydrogenase NADP-binding domain-containing protein [Myxococcales bacterium]|nr:saccharopine dehydrogenase NADP-binding domain-containing protein [Myxococcales bacterium]
MGGKRRVLVVGGYGAVGHEVGRVLAADRDRLDLVVGGRDAAKAAAVAAELGVEHLRVDVDDRASVDAALAGIDLVVNCFIATREPSLAVPEAAATKGIAYVDVAGVPESFCERVLGLGDAAKASGATLVTALGLNPGLVGLLVAAQRAHFDALQSVDVYFVMGGRLGGLTARSMQGIADMVRAPARQWRDGAWQPPAPKSCGRKARPPFDRNVYFGPAMITTDLVGLPSALGLDAFRFWSGMERTLQGMAFLLGIRWGRADTPERAERFLRRLRWLGGKKSSDEIGLEVVAQGVRGAAPFERRVSFHCREELATALGAAFAVRQWLVDRLRSPGAFVPHQALDLGAFVDQLRQAPVGYEGSEAPLAAGGPAADLLAPRK